MIKAVIVLFQTTSHVETVKTLPGRKPNRDRRLNVVINERSKTSQKEKGWQKKRGYVNLALQSFWFNFDFEHPT